MDTMTTVNEGMASRQAAPQDTLSLLRRVEAHLARHIDVVGGAAAAPTTAELLGDVRAVLD